MSQLTVRKHDMSTARLPFPLEQGAGYGSDGRLLRFCVMIITNVV